MSKSFAELRAERDAAAFEAELIEKVAEVQSVFGDSPEMVALVNEALDVVEEEGLATDPIDALEKAAELAYHHLHSQDEESEEAPELDKEAQAQVDEATELGKLAAAVAFDAGVTSSDIENMSEAQAEAFGRALAQSVEVVLQDQEG